MVRGPRRADLLTMTHANPGTGSAAARRARVLRIFADEGWGNLELLDGWDGEDLEEIRALLRDDEFQTLLDALQDDEER